MSVFSAFEHDSYQHQPISACHLIFNWPALEAMQPSSRINNILKRLNFVESGVSKLRLDTFDGTSYTEQNGVVCF